MGLHLFIPNPIYSDDEISGFKSRHLRLSTTTVDLVGIEQGTYLSLSAELTYDLNLFGAICDEIMLNIESPYSTAANVIDVVGRWSKLLNASLDSPNKLAVIGLMSELIVLRELIQIGGSSAIQNWTGPDSARHDFEFSKHSLEVKGSTVLTKKICTIHGASQLEKNEDTGLSVGLVQLEWHPSGTSLPEIKNDIDSKMTKLEKAEFSAKLSDIGFDEDKIASAGDFKFKIFGWTLFDVNQDFPAITSSVIDEIKAASGRISRLEYQLLLSGLPEANLSIAEYLQQVV